MSERFLTVPDADLVLTSAYRETKRAVELACEHETVVVMYGPAGTGKTRATTDAFAALNGPKPVYWKPDDRTTAKQAVVALLKNATGVNYSKERRYDAGDALIEFFRERGRPAHIDEAHNLMPGALEALRHIYKDDGTRMPLVLSGGVGLADTIAKNPEFDRLCVFWVEFTPLRPRQVLNVMPIWHPLYENATELQLKRIDEQFAEGLFGRWAAFTSHYLTELSRLQRPLRLDDDLIDTVLNRQRRSQRTAAHDRLAAQSGERAPGRSRRRRSKAPRSW